MSREEGTKQDGTKREGTKGKEIREEGTKEEGEENTEHTGKEGTMKEGTMKEGTKESMRKEQKGQNNNYKTSPAPSHTLGPASTPASVLVVAAGVATLSCGMTRLLRLRRTDKLPLSVSIGEDLPIPSGLFR